MKAEILHPGEKQLLRIIAEQNPSAKFCTRFIREWDALFGQSPQSMRDAITADPLGDEATQLSQLAEWRAAAKLHNETKLDQVDYRAETRREMLAACWIFGAAVVVVVVVWALLRWL